MSQPIHIPTLIRFAFGLLPSLIAIARLLRELEIDVVYLNTSTPAGSAIAARVRKVPIIWHVREVIDTKSWVGQFVAYCVRRLADVVVANSDFSAHALEASGSLAGELQCVYDGVSLIGRYPEEQIMSVRQQWGFDHTAQIVGMISPVTYTKGQLVFLDAIPRILEAVPHARFVIAGGATLPETYWQTWRGRLRHMIGQRAFTVQMRQYAREKGAEHVTHFDGWRMDIPLVVSALDVVVFPSIIPEGFGRPQVEAGSASKPVVASDIGPARELIEDGVTGILFPPGDSQALAQAVISLLQDKQRSVAMGLAGRQRVEQYFSDEIHALEMLRIFQSVVSCQRDSGE